MYTHFSAFILKCYCCRWFVFLPFVLALFQPGFHLFFHYSTFTISQNCVVSIIIIITIIIVVDVAIFCLRALARANECSMWCNVYLFSCPSLIYAVWMNMLFIFERKYFIQWVKTTSKEIQTKKNMDEKEIKQADKLVLSNARYHH